MPYTLTLTPNRDPGPIPGMKLVRYVRTGDHVHAELHEWSTDDSGRTFKSRVREGSVDRVRHEHAGPTIRITSRLQLIADGLLKPATGKRWRKSMATVATRDKEIRHVGPGNQQAA
jgi:hypothetical protein